ncbi:MAG: methylmalonyl-CoA mutase family protein [Rhodothermales bacterium]
MNKRHDRTSPERERLGITDSGIPVDPVYEVDPSSCPPPGVFPFTRGVYEEMYRSRLWTMRQYSGFATAEESNARYRYLLAQGVRGLSVAFDLPTQIGYDSDDPIAEGEVGKVGVAIDSLDDMVRLFDGIDLSEVTTSMTINSTAAILLALYVAAAEQKGIDRKVLGGTIQNDVLKEYAARGTYIYPPGPSMRLVTDIIEWCDHEMPRWNTISISGYHIREAGATAVQELAFTLANGIAYVEAARARGLDVDRFGSRLSFFFNAHNDFFEEIAKFRAARRAWARIMKDRFGASNPKAMQCRFHVQTGGSTLTAQQPDNNIVRVTIQALAAVLGGTQSLHTNGADEALGLPTEEAARTALRTQQIIAHESGSVRTADPLGGSSYVEYLTDEIERRAVDLIGTIDQLGGAVSAIETGFYQREIGRSAYEAQIAIESGEKIVVGVNAYSSEDAVDPNVFRVDESVGRKQTERLREIRSRRNKEVHNQAVARIRSAAESDDNLMPAILDAVTSDVTLGEISNALRSVWGEYGS